MKKIILLMLAMFVSTVAYGEVYKWQDENGMHFTDNPLSIPKKYRDKVFADTPQNSQIQHSTQPIPLNNNFQAAENRKPLAGNTIGFPQYPVRPKKSFQKNASLEDALNQLERFITIVILMGACLLLVWILTIVDIIRSEFTDPSNKIVWFLLVLFLPLLGMILYCFIGTGQKKPWISPKERSQRGSLTRLYPDKSKEGEFTIM